MRLQTFHLKRVVVVFSSLIAMLAATMIISDAAGELGESYSPREQSVRQPTAPPVVVPTDSPAVDPEALPGVVHEAFPSEAPGVLPEVPDALPVVVDPPPVDPTTSPVFRSTLSMPTLTSRDRPSADPAVNLRTAGSFAVLTKTGVTDVFASTIRGNVGASPITGSAIGLTCPEVTGTIYSVDVAGPRPCGVADATRLTTAVSDQEAAYTDAAGRTDPDFVNLGAGQIGGMTLAPGVYKWTSGLLITNDVTLSGSPNDVFIFQIAGTLTQAAAKKVVLTGGAQARNVFWQTTGAVTIGTTAHSEGTILSKTMIALNTGASTNGRLLAQTQATLQKNVVTIAR